MVNRFRNNLFVRDDIGGRVGGAIGAVTTLGSAITLGVVASTGGVAAGAAGIALGLSVAAATPVVAQYAGSAGRAIARGFEDLSYFGSYRK